MEWCSVLIYVSHLMMTSSNGNIFRVTGTLCGEFTGPGSLMFSLMYTWINDWVNNREAGDLRRHRGHYDVIVMYIHFCFGYIKQHFSELLAIYASREYLTRSNQTYSIMLWMIQYNRSLTNAVPFKIRYFDKYFKCRCRINCRQQ